MLASIFFDPRLFVILFRIDSDLAEQVRSQGCRCGGSLHSANYPRKPRAPADLGPEHSRRFSLCCNDCRRRTTPPSVRFLGRRVHAFPVVVLVTSLAAGISGARLAKLRDEFGVDRRTLERWRAWWRDAFPATRFWKKARADFSPPVDATDLASILGRFVEGLDGLIDCLRFLSPLSRGTHTS